MAVSQASGKNSTRKISRTDFNFIRQVYDNKQHVATKASFSELVSSAEDQELLFGSVELKSIP